jgi:REP element-mobilizing transposase RayT
MLIHLAARTVSNRRAFKSRDSARWLWKCLRDLFPDALAACLMPDHLHVLLDVRDSAAARLSLARLLGAFSRYRNPETSWCVADPQIIPNSEHLRRQVRYVHLNPCRAHLVDDPLSWAYSTHRGLVGAELDPWVTPERLAPLLRLPVVGFEQDFNAYVSADPSVNPAGTPFPKPAPPRITPAASDAEIRSSGAEMRRALPRRRTLARKRHGSGLEP